MQANDQEKRRKRFFAIGAFVCGLITFAIALEEQSLAIDYLSHTICGIAWFILATLFQFSSIQQKQIEFLAFVNMSGQILLTQIVHFLLIDVSAETYFTSASNILFLLNIFFVTTFLLFPKRRATLLSVGFAVLSTIVILIGATRLPTSLVLSQLIDLLQPAIYIIIGFFLVRALATFRLEAHAAKSEAKQYEKLAYFDELTGIANRRKLVNLLQKEISTSRRYGTPLSIIIFDIDHFKKINDTYGHNVGDEVLKALANSVTNTIRTSDSLGRLGGEEFMCILPNTKADVAFELAEHLRIGIANSLMENGPNITASFGIAQLMQVDNYDSFVLRADQALYSAKAQGRNRCKPNPLHDTTGLFNFEQLIGDRISN